MTLKPREWGDQGLYAAWVGHTTVLLKLDGTTILTDPVFSRRIGINLGIGTLGVRRLVDPALSLRELPKIDVILLSHAHFDHFDLPSLRRLEHAGTQVVTASKTADLLRRKRYAGVTELGWGAGTRVGPLTIRAFPVRHWGARLHRDSWRGYNGYTIDAGRYRVLFGGDTAATTSFRALKGSRAFDLAIMPVGAYNPWIRNHCTPEQAWQMAEDAGSEFFLPVHHQTFSLSREPYREPIERVQQAAGRRQERVAVREIGGEFRLD
ncbi:MAG TPA: MBL fold metallo-hydrolase [Candidatus Sulfopaludibacter sp.]|jgi:L-ascorbate metabolism protein UlaG (beta-lactamase superfamily)|nr:MBL fold metallo-hydrolase [Candidatus Sulfopaludibacter sp.]